MNVVVDTNVLVSGLLSPFGPPGEIVRMIASVSLSLCFDARILSEYSDVLIRAKFQFDAEQIYPLLDQIRAEGQVVAGEPLRKKLPDPTDEPFLEAAIAGNARCLITGNMRHFPVAKCQGIKVLSPNEFLDFYRHEIRRRTPEM